VASSALSKELRRAVSSAFLSRGICLANPAASLVAVRRIISAAPVILPNAGTVF